MDPTFIMLIGMLVVSFIWVLSSMGYVHNTNRHDERNLEDRLTAEKLAEDVRQEAGFDVFVHAVGREKDLNDFKPNETNNYVRAVHNLKNPKPDYGNIIPVYDSIGGSIGNDNSNSRMTEFDVVAYGPLIKDKLKETRPERKGGMFRKHRFAEHKKVLEIEKNIPLSDIVDTNSNEQAYFLSLTLRATIYDRAKRWGHTPTLTIVGDKQLIETTVKYLKKHPENYMRFIKDVLPENEFPKVNSGIIDKATLGDSIIFLDTNEIYGKAKTDKEFYEIRDMAKGFNGKLKEWVYEMAERKGERIPVSSSKK